MDPRLLEYYQRELQFMRETGAEFARLYPRVAARLGLDEMECADPYVERLLEGFAFLAARVQLKLDARHPQFTQQLMELVYPGLLAPIPSAAIVELSPNLEESTLKSGVLLARNSAFRTPPVKGERPCEFRSAQDVVMWPVQVSEASYLSGTGAVTQQGSVAEPRAKAAIRLRLSTVGGMPFSSLPLDSLTFFVKGTPGVAARIYEQIHSSCVGVRVRHAAAVGDTRLGAGSVEEVGFDDASAMLPVTRTGFGGFRLLQEYFILPERFMFFRLKGLGPAAAATAGEDLEITLLLDRIEKVLENALDAGNFRLHCTPVINLFRKACGRIELHGRDVDYHILPDRNRPQDFEVYDVTEVTGIGRDGADNFRIAPFYSASHRSAANEDRAYYTLQRRPRLTSMRQARTGERTTYLGSECFISVADTAQRFEGSSPLHADIVALCTNRDLPILATFGKGRTDFVLDTGAPVDCVRCVVNPTPPRPAPAWGESSWRVISHLSLNYLSIEKEGLNLLRDFLALYARPNDSVATRQIEGLKAIDMQPVVRRLPLAGPISYGRGLAITVTLHDDAFEGTGLLPLGAALERFFSRYVSLNSFTQVRLQSATRGQIKEWPVRIGSRHVL